MSITRATFTLSTPLLQQLRGYSAATNIPMSKVVEAGITHVLQQEQAQQLAEMYQGLQSLKGIGPTNATNVSNTIDETLYGPTGTWKDQAAK